MSDTQNDIVTTQKVVSFTYVIFDEEGHVLEQSDIPMSYIHGIDGKMYPSAEKAMEGKSIGDKVEAIITPEEGFGYPDAEMMYVDKIENIPPEYREIGAEALFQDEAGETMTMKVTKIEDGEITLDANHPFAGKTVTFRITVVGIRNATEQEVGTGEVVDLSAPISTMQ